MAAFMEQKPSRFQRIITGDESCLVLYYPHDSVGAASRNELFQRIMQKTEAEKCLVSIFWSINGIHSSRDMPKETTYNTVFFTHIIMPSLIEDVQ
jgi:hypothetical protein